MAEIFADTSGWGNLIDRSQKHHRIAASLYRQAREQGDRFITTNYVLSELVALLISPLNISRPQAIAFINRLKQSPYVEIVHIGITTDAQAWQLFSQRPDKNWSLVDCSSFVIMNLRQVTTALTNDRHFEQAGFVRLLKD